MNDAPFELERCSVSEVAEPGGTAGYFSDAELDRAARLRTDKRRREWLAARLAAKRLAARRLNREGFDPDPRRIEVSNHPDGPPYLSLPDGCPAPEPLSISHSGGWGVAAAAPRGRLIGVDVEKSAPRHASFLSVVAHDSERDPALESDPTEQTRLWTLKEAVSKLLGTGLSVGFWDIRLVPHEGSRRLELHRAARERWEELGRPDIHLDSEVGEDGVLSVAYTGDRNA